MHIAEIHLFFDIVHVINFLVVKSVFFVCLFDMSLLLMSLSVLFLNYLDCFDLLIIFALLNVLENILLARRVNVEVRQALLEQGSESLIAQP